MSRVLHSFNEFRYRLEAPIIQSDRTVIFSNRLVNDSWKRSFASECSALSLVSAVSDEENERVEQLLRSDEKLRAAYAKYEGAPKPGDLIVNLRFGPLPNGGIDVLKAACAKSLDDTIPNGLILDEVLELLRDAGYYECLNGIPQSATLQLVCPNHELRGRDFLLRSYRILGF